MKVILIVVSVLTISGFGSKRNRRARSCNRGGVLRRGSLAEAIRLWLFGLVWKTSDCAVAFGRHVPNQSGKGHGTVDRFHRRSRLRGCSEHASMGSQTVRRAEKFSTVEVDSRDADSGHQARRRVCVWTENQQSTENQSFHLVRRGCCFAILRFTGQLWRMPKQGSKRRSSNQYRNQRNDMVSRDLAVRGKN